MITHNDAKSLSPHFIDVCKKSTGLLRFSSIPNIINLKKSIIDLRAENLANISKLTSQLKLCADIMIKEQEEELYPLLEAVSQHILKSDTPAVKCLKAAELIKARVNRAVEQRLNVDGGSGAYIENYESVAKAYAKETMFRDASAAYDIFNLISSSNEEQAIFFDIIGRLKNISVRFTAKHYNALLKIRSEIEKNLSQHDNLIAVSDACDVAIKISNSPYGKSPDVLDNFLNQSVDYIIDKTREIYV